MAKRIPPLIWYFGGAVLFLVVVSLLIMGLAGVFHPKIGQDEHGVPEAEVRTLGERPVVEARLVSMPLVETAVGTISAIHETTIAAKILARVTEVNVSAGEQVAEGAVLVRLDDADLRARLEQAAAAVVSATAARDQAQVEFDRINELFEAHNAARIEFERAETELKTATSELQRCQQSRLEIAAILEYATIRSPMSAKVVDKLVEVGDIATPGQPLLKMYDATRMQLVARVRESLTQRLSVGQDIQVRIDALEKTCTGSVREIVPEADAASRAFSVKVSGPCPPGLYTGMFGRLLIPLDPEEVLVIPGTALARIGQLCFVDVVDQVDGKAVLSRCSVQLGRTFEGGNVEVLSGLVAGERVALPPGGGQ
ncbi:MAG: efflux RND transporter periplasmic adaptor subunit [Planctomycetes bacterium]|nr:efflux RND transporter periplasmic adaptor subunit [Planctomycetota bacterium]